MPPAGKHCNSINVDFWVRSGRPVWRSRSEIKRRGDNHGSTHLLEERGLTANSPPAMYRRVMVRLIIPTDRRSKIIAAGPCERKGGLHGASERGHHRKPSRSILAVTDDD